MTENVEIQGLHFAASTRVTLEWCFDTVKLIGQLLRRGLDARAPDWRDWVADVAKKLARTLQLTLGAENRQFGEVFYEQYEETGVDSD